MIIPGEITNNNNHNEMTSEIPPITSDLTLIAESEKTISTEPKFGFFDRQMAELEPAVNSIVKVHTKIIIENILKFI